MKFALIFLLSALVALSQQQFLRPRPHGLVWWSPYLNSQPSAHHNAYLSQSLYDGADQEDVLTPLSARRYRPSRPMAVYQNEDLNVDFSNDGQNNDEADGLTQYADSQQRVNAYRGFNGGRLFYSSTINNPFFKTATFTISSTVTTLASIVVCVPANNLAANPAPACAGRKRRGMDESEVHQFPITPSETLKLTPTAVPSLDLEARQLLSDEEKNAHELISSKDEAAKIAEIEKPREKRFFGGGIAASTTVVSYSFIGATVTSTVLLDPTGANLAACLPAGYVVCA